MKRSFRPRIRDAASYPVLEDPDMGRRALLRKLLRAGLVIGGGGALLATAACGDGRAIGQKQPEPDLPHHAGVAPPMDGAIDHAGVAPPMDGAIDRPVWTSDGVAPPPDAGIDTRPDLMVSGGLPDAMPAPLDSGKQTD